jgi:putative restriction endonuclease
MPNRFEWGHRAWPILTSAARRRQTMTYGELGDVLGIGGATPVRNALWPIQDLCIEKNWPALTSIVLNKGTGEPGGGFIARDKTLADAHERVFAFPWHKYPVPFPKDFIERIEEAGTARAGKHSDPDEFDVSDQMVLVNGRRAFQSRFREMLLRAYDYECALCETGLESMLIASHIVPWAADQKNRLNPRNGVLLCRTHDCLFDSSIIRITPDAKVSWPGVKSQTLGRDLFAFLTKRTASRLRMPPARYRPDREFLQWRLDNPQACDPNDGA